MTRGTSNKIRRCLPPEILRLLDSGVETQSVEPGVTLWYDGRGYDFGKLTSRLLNFIIKVNKNKIV